MCLGPPDTRSAWGRDYFKQRLDRTINLKRYDWGAVGSDCNTKLKTYMNPNQQDHSVPLRNAHRPREQGTGIAKACADTCEVHLTVALDSSSSVKAQMPTAREHEIVFFF